MSEGPLPWSRDFLSSGDCWRDEDLLAEPLSVPVVREFETGATRDVEDGKYDFEGALSPAVLWAFAGYMHKHRFLKDGTVRTADNWQKGFPEDVLVKSLLRHVMDLWMLHRGYAVERPEDGKAVDWDDALGGIMFNAQALWHASLNGE